MEITEFLTARYDEDEAIALAAIGNRSGNARWDSVRGQLGKWQIGTAAGDLVAFEAQDQFYAAHIVAWDPARVLADIAAKQAIVAEHRRGSMVEERDETECITCSAPSPGLAGLWGVEYPCRTLRLLAAPHVEHPDYDPAWRIDATT